MAGRKSRISSRNGHVLSEEGCVGFKKGALACGLTGLQKSAKVRVSVSAKIEIKFGLIYMRAM